MNLLNRIISFLIIVTFFSCNLSKSKDHSIEYVFTDKKIELVNTTIQKIMPGTIDEKPYFQLSFQDSNVDSTLSLNEVTYLNYQNTFNNSRIYNGNYILKLYEVPMTIISPVLRINYLDNGNYKIREVESITKLDDLYMP